MTLQIPRIGDTEDVSLNQKTIYQKWTIPQLGFYWLIAEIDPEKERAFGYANLNDDHNAEWGYVSLADLKDVDAIMDENWISKKFIDCMGI